MDMDDLDFQFVPEQRKPSRSRFLSKPKSEPQSLDNDVTVFHKKIEKDTKMSSIVKEEVDDSMMNVDHDDDGEDFVVREIDVYFSVDEDSQIYAMQYPLRPSWRPYELDKCCEEVRVRPKSVQVEVDLSVDVQSKNFDAGWAGKREREMAKERHYDDDWVSNVKLNKQTLSSSWKPPCSTGYAIGILKDNKLHLSPVCAVLQLRPSIEHLKPDELVGKIDAKEFIGSSKTPGQLNEQNTTDKECWVTLKYHSSKSEYAASYIQNLMAEEESCSPMQFSMDPYKYVNSLCPGASNYNISSSKSHSRKPLLSLPLEEPLKKWLCAEKNQVHRFSTIKHLAPDVPVKEFLDVLQKYAILVQGLWVPKSGVVLSQQQGQKKQIFIRDYLLFLFSQSRNVSYSEISKFIKVARGRKMGDFEQLVNRFLKILGIDRPDLADWKFKEPTDMIFIKLHPQIVEEQQKLFEGLGTRLTQTLYGR